MLDTNALSRLAELGISSDRSGKLSLTDGAKLDSVLSTKLGQVESLFGASGGVASRLYDLVSNFAGTNGNLEQERNLLNGQSKRLTERIAQIDSQLANVGALAALDPQVQQVTRPLEQLEFVNRHVPLRALHRATFARERVERLPRHA